MNEEKELIKVMTVFKQGNKYGVGWNNADTNKYEILGFLRALITKLEKEHAEKIDRKE